VAVLASGSNWLTNAEQIEIHWSALDDDLIVDVCSRSRAAFHPGDGGRNAKNVARLIEGLTLILDASPPTPVPLCANCSYVLLAAGSTHCPECGRDLTQPGGTCQQTPQPSFLQRMRSAAVFAVVVVGTQSVLFYVLGAYCRFGPFRWMSSNGRYFVIFVASSLLGIGLGLAIAEGLRRRK